MSGRRSGIAAVGGVSWGTHICLFYHAKEDLLDILVPYFKAGLEDNEFCFWATSAPEDEETLKERMSRYLPDFLDYLKRGQMVIIPFDRWYLRNGVFDADRVIGAWVKTLEEALSCGFAGLRVAVDVAPLEDKQWDVFMEYEATVNMYFARYQTLALCAYPFERCGAIELIEVANNHHLCLLRHQGKWRILESAERKRLKEREEMYSTIVEKGGDGIVVIQDGLLKFVNPKVLEMTGFSPEEVIGKPFLAFIAPAYRKLAAENYERRMKGEALKARYEVEILAKDGSRIPVEVDASLINFAGKPADLAMLRDIRERKQAELLLQQSEERYRTLVENSIQGILVVQDFRIVYCNQACAEITGYSVPELLSLSPQQVQALVHPDDQPLVWGRYQARQRGEAMPSHYEYRGIRKDGRIAWYEMIATQITYQGKPAVMAAVIDITERKEALEALRRSEERYRTLVDTSPAGIVLLGRDEIVTFASPRMLELLGDPEKSEVVGHPPYKWLAEEYQEQARSHMANILAGRSPGYQSEYLLLKKDGTCFWGQTCSAPVKDELGNIAGVLAVVEDITERKRAEEELEASRQQLRNFAHYLEAAQERERTRIAHELHDEMAQSLTALKMDLSWLRKELPPNWSSLSGKVESMSRLVDNAMERVKRIVAELRPSVLDDLGLAAALEWQAEEFQKRTNIPCQVSIIPKDIAVDPAMATALFRIAQEALTNIARHANATKAEVKLRKRAGKLFLQVRDNGKGISKDKLVAPDSLGLVGMRERVLPWKGELKIRGIKGKGTTVTAILPLSKRERA